MHAERIDGLVGIAGCDKSEPGMLMAMARLNLPSVYLYGGTILPGTYDGPRHHDPGRLRGGRRARQGHDRRRRAAARSSARRVRRPARAPACTRPTRWPPRPRRSACRCPAAASPPAVDYRREVFARESGLAADEACSRRIRARATIMTREAFENAIAVVMALAGSTNAVLHLLAIAREARVELELDDFDRIARDVPHLVDVRPAGQVRDERPRPCRRRAGRDEGAARRRAAARRLRHGDRQDDRREPRGSMRAARRPTATSCTRWSSRSTRGRHSRSCAARSPPTAR